MATSVRRSETKGAGVEPTWVAVGKTEDGRRSSARVAVLELGDPAGPPVVLIPGLTDGLHPVWHPRGRVLFDGLPFPMDRCRGLVVSHRHPLEPSVTTRDLADDLAEAMRSTIDRPAVVICHSMGTMVAQHLMAAHPGLIAGLVLSAPLAVVDDDLRDVVRRWAAHVRDHRWTALAIDTLECSYTGGELQRRRDLLGAAPRDVPVAELRQRHLRLSEVCLTHETPRGLEDVEVPALVLAGECDPVAPPRHAHMLADSLARARLHVLPGLAHGFPEQAASIFSSFVTTFLGEVAATAGSWFGEPAS